MSVKHRMVAFALSGTRRSVRPALVAAAAAGVVLAFGALTGGAANGRTVRSSGDESFVPNGKVMATLKFAPGNLTVTSGETITFVHDDQTQDPHTLSIVDESDVPTDIEDVLNCGAPGTICDQVFSAFPAQPTGSEFNNVSGGPGLDGRLDTLFLVPGEPISAPVTAPAGTVLHFMCAIHAWMQGTITVK